jgi:hypothetical protein
MTGNARLPEDLVTPVLLAKHKTWLQTVDSQIEALIGRLSSGS